MSTGYPLGLHLSFPFISHVEPFRKIKASLCQCVYCGNQLGKNYVEHIDRCVRVYLLKGAKDFPLEDRDLKIRQLKFRKEQLENERLIALMTRCNNTVKKLYSDNLRSAGVNQSVGHTPNERTIELLWGLENFDIEVIKSSTLFESMMSSVLDAHNGHLRISLESSNLIIRLEALLFLSDFISNFLLKIKPEHPWPGLALEAVQYQTAILDKIGTILKL
jgi:hypothetical protein